MVENTKIEWATHTFSPWVGCTKISPACDHCYAEGWAKRTGQAGLWQGERRRTRPENWKGPLKWNRQAQRDGTRPRVFCSSLADVFDNEVDPRWRSDLFKLIEATHNLDWLLLTKRIGNVRAMTGGVSAWPNVWLGATIANQEEADRDIPKLLATPARVRFLSCEPLLGPLDFSGRFVEHANLAVHENWLEALDWVIAGGESGPNARPSHPDWFRSLRDQCAAAGVPFFFKQWGEFAPAVDLPFEMERFGKKAAGRTLDGRVHDEFPKQESTR